MKIAVYHVDAFARTVFEGKATAVCVLKSWLPEMLMQAIASELGVATTAFVARKGSDFRIRWFSQGEEVEQSGHATLAAAHVLYQHCSVSTAALRFHYHSGQVIARAQDDGSISLDLPVRVPEPVDLNTDIIEAVGGNPQSAVAHRDLIVVFGDATEVSILSPDMKAIAALPYGGVCATAPSNGNEYDFACRYFAPAKGLDEDPATGSVYAELAPYYLQRWGTMEFSVRQLSKRGAELRVNITGDRVHIAGFAKTVMKGAMMLDH